MEEQIKSVKQAGEKRKSLLAAFLEECYVVDFLQEYGKDSGIAERWGICTQLTADGIEEKYGEIVDRYRPYMVIPRGKTNPFAEYHTNEEKFKKGCSVMTHMGLTNSRNTIIRNWLWIWNLNLSLKCFAVTHMTVFPY